VALSVELWALIVGVLSLLVTIIRPVRTTIGVVVDRTLILAGSSRRRYAGWFLHTYGTVRNIYLDRTEELDLANTYVPLTVRNLGGQSRVLAATIMGDPVNARLIVLGEPGSGKSTLLKAYGIGLLREARGRPLLQPDRRLMAVAAWLPQRRREVPFFVSLRALGSYLDVDPSRQRDGLHRYLVEEVLARQAKVRASGVVLRRWLDHGEVVLLLDGLDEVTDSHYTAVRDAVLEFAKTESRGARAVLSCRRQNFAQMRAGWIPVFTTETHTLAPLSDPEIHAFIDRRRSQFGGGRSVNGFFASILASGMVELHRVPLILTISLGLYLNLTAYQIPSSLTKFYDEMINDLLRRHDFRLDPSLGMANRFQAEDKRHFLREFALAMALRPDRFDEFGYDDLDRAARELSQRLVGVPTEEVRQFIKEIVDRSGLVTRVTDDHGRYIFAHRSIQEYFAAVQLQRRPAEGAAFLCAAATDLRWRQVAVLFAGLDHDYVEPYLTTLAEANLELAGTCLAVAKPVSDKLVLSIVAQLAAEVRERREAAACLAALVAATRAPKESVRQAALVALTGVLRNLPASASDLDGLLGLRADSVLPLMDALAGSSSGDVAGAVIELAGLLPSDDDRQIGPLWRILSAETRIPLTAAETIVHRLLVRATTPAGFAALKEQPPLSPDFATERLRAKVYPFTRVLPRDANLVTLLCWADHLEMQLPAVNRYLAAQAEDPAAFQTLERHRRGHAVSGSVVGRALAGCGAVAGLTCLAFSVRNVGWRSILPDPHRPWSAILYLLPVLGSFGLVGFLNGMSHWSRSRWSEALALVQSEIAIPRAPVPGPSKGSRLVLADRPEPALRLVRWWSSGALALLAVPLLMYSVAVRTALPGLPSWAYLTLAVPVSWLLFWLPATWICAYGTRIYLRKPHPFIDVYRDPASRHWVEPAGKPPEVGRVHP
jgi:energy-coupling factor transporter ATP-binding protein EcfA2